MSRKKEETLVILMEECSEVIKEASKILRFGGDTDKLCEELGDILCMVELTAKNLDIPYEDIEDGYYHKYNKLYEWSNIT
jgi:NTP pyrophosphatase (non-canonical NTP hydrolase)